MGFHCHPLTHGARWNSVLHRGTDVDLRSGRVSEKFGPDERIHLQRDFSRIQNLGLRFTTGCLSIIWCDQSPQESGEAVLPSHRVAIKVRYRVGNAVTRNRIKRILRELYRHEKRNIRSGTDMIFLVVPFAGARRASYGNLRESWVKLCKISGIWVGE